ncbi:MAG TPA: DsbA family oxidoreductase [Polyangia bacterium]|nr:DsbA family oxidoreductase [Polyangia bacterium]
MKKLRIDVWSDIVCPWCAIGSRRLERALEQFPHRDQVEVFWHAFELDPSAPRVHPGDHVGHIADKFGRPPEQARAIVQRVIDLAAQDGLTLRLMEARAGNTFDGHRLLQLAAARGIEPAVRQRFFRGYMTEGEPIGDPAVLARLATEAGLDPDEVQAVLTSDQYAQDVRDDEAAATAIGIGGVPFFIMAGRVGVSGAQPVDVFSRALAQAWDKQQAADDEPAAG